MTSTVAIFVQLGFEIYVKNNYRTTSFLNFLQKQIGVNINTKTKKRIRFYTAQSALTNLWFSTLRGYYPSLEEKNLALYLGAFTPLADDLMDTTGLKFSELKSFNQNSTAQGTLFSLLFEHMSDACRTNNILDHYFKKAHSAQDESLKQLLPEPLGIDKLTKITKNKGGHYTTLYRCILQNDLQLGEAEAIYKLGAVLQLINDLFDAWKDAQNGVQTLVNQLQDVPALQALFNHWVADFIDAYQVLPYPQKNIQRSLASVMCIVARGQVALNQFAVLQKNHGHFNISAFDRKALIVDMESAKNIKQNMQSARILLKKPA